MASSPVERLLQALHSWEAEYAQTRHQLRLADVYLLWITTFRISRQLIADYHDRRRRGAIDAPSRAYTGKTRRLR